MLLQNYLLTNKKNGFCILGTDTGIGKTYVTCALLEYFNNIHYKTLGIKPIASGAVWNEDQWYNDDALALQKYSSLKVPYKIINPMVFEKPVAPHLAAMAAHEELSVKRLLNVCENTFRENADMFLVEGCGGILTPLNFHETFMDFVMELRFPIILVVGMRLGCLNHARLTCAYLSSMSIPTVGWIANFFDPNFLEPAANLETLEKTLPFPLLGTVRFNEGFQAV